MNWHLAIETSGREGSLALFNGSLLLQQVDLGPDPPLTVSSAPALENLLSLMPSDQRLTLVSVVDGPGSFTGLRIGITMAKTLCFATGAALVCVDALQILCEMLRTHLVNSPQRFGLPQSVAVATNAYRQQVFMRQEPLDLSSTDLSTVASKVIDVPQWEDLRKKKSCYCLGKLSEGQVSPISITCDRWPRPMAAQLGPVAWKMYELGKKDDFWTISPRYLRKSAAEEKAEEKNQSPKAND